MIDLFIVLNFGLVGDTVLDFGLVGDFVIDFGLVGDFYLDFGLSNFILITSASILATSFELIISLANVAHALAFAIDLVTIYVTVGGRF